MSETVHKLQNRWKLWLALPGGDVTEVTTIETVEDFWTMMHWLEPVSNIPQKTDYYLFKEGIRPVWEDPMNENGGGWEVFPELDNDVLNKIWTELWIAIIAEQFGEKESAIICGARVGPRSQRVRYALWTSPYDDEEGNMSIGRTFQKVVRAHASFDPALTYKKHTGESTVRYRIDAE